MRNYILTGTPGAGKTSLIRALETRGYPVVEEAATDIIAIKQDLGITAPWEEPCFIDNIVGLQKERQLGSSVHTGLVQFHDRSAICCYALCQYLGKNPSAFLLQEIRRLKEEKIFEEEVFFVENLGFCTPTAARKISFEQSLVFEEMHKEAYRKFGYRMIPIGRDTLEGRMEKILKCLT